MLEQCSLIRFYKSSTEMVANVLYLWGNPIKKNLKEKFLGLETVLAMVLCS